MGVSYWKTFHSTPRFFKGSRTHIGQNGGRLNDEKAPQRLDVTSGHRLVQLLIPPPHSHPARHPSAPRLSLRLAAFRAISRGPLPICRPGLEPVSGDW